MTPLELLTRMRARLEKPEAWCQGDFARDARGNVVVPVDAKACTWCVNGAAYAESVELGVVLEARRLIVPNARRSGDAIVAFNDAPGRTHAEILALLDAGIARAKEATNG